MGKPPFRAAERSPLSIEEIEAWEQGAQPDELVNSGDDLLFDTSDQVKAYMLAHQHFLKAVSDIMKVKGHEDTNPYQQVYQNLLAYCADRAEIAVKWNISHQHPFSI